MSDILSRLLLRAGIDDAASAEVALLRPRSPSRFEPAATTPIPGFAATEAGPADEDAMPAALPRPAPSVAPPEDQVAQIAAPRSPVPPVVPATGSPERQRDRDRDRPRTPERPLHREPAATAEHEYAPGRPDRPLAAFASPVPEVVRAASVAPPPTANAPTPAPRPEPSRERPPVGAKPEAASPVIRPKSVAVPAPARPPAPSIGAPEPAPPETVIEIGRVEIVAARPETRRPVPPRRPTTTLAGYLDRRRGG